MSTRAPHGDPQNQYDRWPEIVKSTAKGADAGIYLGRLIPKEEAFFPLHGLWEAKFWPPAGRIGNVSGNRHLMCGCPPIGSYREVVRWG